MPRGVARWVCDFLSNRFQRVKLYSDCFSEWGAVPYGVPKGTELGHWLFLLMINGLNPPDAPSRKYVDDTSLAALVQRNGRGHTQKTVTDVEKWSNVNKLQFNADRYQEIIIEPTEEKHQFDIITVNSQELELVSSAKVLGVTISNSLEWVSHVNDVIKKANKRLYFLILLKRAHVPVTPGCQIQELQGLQLVLVEMIIRTQQSAIVNVQLFQTNLFQYK